MKLINRTEISRGVFLNTIEDSRFKKQKMYAALAFPLTREYITHTALLPYMLSRGTQSCPDMTQLARLLAMLYGADISRSVAKEGFLRTLCVSADGPNADFLPDKTVARQYAQLLKESLFKPVMPNGKFDPQWLEIEKGKLRETIQADFNDKRGYNLSQTARAFYGEYDLRSLDSNGCEEDLQQITAESLTEVYNEIISTARVEILCIGAQVDPEQFAGIPDRTPAVIPGVTPVEKREAAVYVRTPDDVVQQKLAMFFTAGELLTEKQRAAFRVANAVLGSVPTSRLFFNVREKLSLCYYCASVPDYRGATLRIDSGIEKGNEQKTADAIMKELESLQKGEITDKELREAKLYIKNELLGVNDSVQALGGWYLPLLLRQNKVVTPQEAVAQSEAVTPAEVAELLSMFTLNTVGYLSERKPQ